MSVAEATIANNMDFTKQFQNIATTSQPAVTLLRKAMVSVKKDKKLFSPEQLTKVVALLMGSLPYILFRPKSETKDYVLLLFWATSQDDSNFALQKSIQNIKQKILSDGFQLRFTIENVTAPRRQVSYLAQNCLCLKTQNDDICHLPSDSHEQLVNFLNLLQEPAKKRKIEA